MRKCLDNIVKMIAKHSRYDKYLADKWNKMMHAINGNIRYRSEDGNSLATELSVDSVRQILSFLPIESDNNGWGAEWRTGILNGGGVGNLLAERTGRTCSVHGRNHRSKEEEEECIKLLGCSTLDDAYVAAEIFSLYESDLAHEETDMALFRMAVHVALTGYSYRNFYRGSILHEMWNSAVRSGDWSGFKVHNLHGSKAFKECVALAKADPKYRILLSAMEIPEFEDEGKDAGTVQASRPSGGAISSILASVAEIQSTTHSVDTFDDSYYRDFISGLGQRVNVSYNNDDYRNLTEGPCRYVSDSVNVSGVGTSNYLSNKYVIRPLSGARLGTRGPSVELSSMYVTTMAARDNGTSNYSSELRQRLYLANGDVALLHAVNYGDDVSNGVGTSSAEVITRLLNYVMTLNPMSYGVRSMTRDVVWRPDGATSRLADVNYPYGGNPLTDAAMNTSVKAAVATLNDFVSVATGVKQVGAGFAAFAPSTWGETTAVVPIRIRDAEDGNVNAAFTTGYMESPMCTFIHGGSWRHLDGTALAVLAPALGGMQVVNNSVRVPGPQDRVLYVLVDVQTNVLGAAQRAVIGAQVLDTAANGLTGGGAPVDIGDDLRLLASAPDLFANTLYSSIQRWIEMFGNVEDWNTALVAVADVSGWKGTPIVRSGSTVSGIVLNHNAGVPMYPLNGHAPYRMTNTIRANFIASLQTCASGIVPPDRGVAGAAMFLNSTTHSIPRLDPAIHIGSAAGWYKFSFSAKPVTYGICNISTYLMDLNAAMFSVADSMWQSNGMGLLSWLSPRNAVERELLNVFAANYRDILSSYFYTEGLRFDFGGNMGRDVTVAFSDIYPGIVEDWAFPAYRVSPLLAMRNGYGAANAAADNYYGLPGHRFQVVTVGANRYDRLVYEPLELRGQTGQDSAYRRLLSMGVFSVGDDSTAAFQMMSYSGEGIHGVIIPIDDPGNGFAKKAAYDTILADPVTYDYVDVVVGVPFVKVDSSRNFRKVYLAIDGLRELLKGMSSPIPNVVVRTDALINLTGEDYADSENTAVPALLSGFAL
jgi:hypothetical protein